MNKNLKRIRRALLTFDLPLSHSNAGIAFEEELRGTVCGCSAPARTADATGSTCSDGAMRRGKDGGACVAPPFFALRIAQQPHGEVSAPDRPHETVRKSRRELLQLARGYDATRQASRGVGSAFRRGRGAHRIVVDAGRSATFQLPRPRQVNQRTVRRIVAESIEREAAQRRKIDGRSTPAISPNWRGLRHRVG